MICRVVCNPQQPHQLRWCGAMAEGMMAAGVECSFENSGDFIKAGDFALCWGWRIGKKLAVSFENVLVLEAGFIGDRAHWISAGWNGLNGRAKFPAAGDCGDRFSAHFADLFAPWRDAGGYALLAAQVPGDQSVLTHDHIAWLRTTYAAIIDAGFSPLFRPHPVVSGRGYDWRDIYGDYEKAAEGPLQDALTGAAFVVTFNSNLGVDAILAGVPVVAIDAGSMVYDLAAREIGDIIRPSRGDWAGRIAWAQWSEAEMKRGLAWRHLKDLI